MFPGLSSPVSPHEMIPQRAAAIVPVKLGMVDIVVMGTFYAPSSIAKMVFKRKDGQSNDKSLNAQRGRIQDTKRAEEK